MFDYLKHKIKTYAVNPLTGMVHEKQEALARKTAERAATILFWLTAGLTGIFTLILALLSLSLLIGQLLGSYLYGLFIFTALFILIFLILLFVRKRIETPTPRNPKRRRHHRQHGTFPSQPRQPDLKQNAV